jgi:hypothetical protein
MFCSQCGAPLSAAQKYCENCGTANRAAFTLAPESLPGLKRSQTWVLRILIFSVLLSFVGLGLIILVSPKAQQERTSPQQERAVKVLVDIPKLAFRPKLEVERAIGKPKRTRIDSNNMRWHEGTVITAEYPNGSTAVYLSGRLVSLTFNIPAPSRPKTVAEALSMFNLPPEAASLDSPGAAGYRAFNAPNPDYRNPLRCCGLSFHLVQFPSTFSQIWVNYININTHFVCWPVEMQTAWKMAGMPEPVVTGDRRIRVGSTPRGGNLLDAPFIRDRCE